DAIAQAGADAEEVGAARFAGQEVAIGADAVVEEGEELQLVVGLFPAELLAEADRRGAELGVDEEGVVGVYDAFIVAAHGAVPAETELLARDKISAGDLAGDGEAGGEVAGQTL